MYKRGVKRNIILRIPSIQGTLSRWPSWTATHKKKIYLSKLKLFNGLFTAGLPWCHLFYLDRTGGQGDTSRAINAPRRYWPLTAWSRVPREARCSSCSTHSAFSPGLASETIRLTLTCPCILIDDPRTSHVVWLSPLYISVHPLIWFNLLRDSRPFPCSLEKTGQLPNAPYWQPLLWTSSSFLLLNWNLTVPWSHSLLGIRNKGYFSSSTPGLGDGFPVLYASHGGLWNTVCPTPYNFPPKTEFWWSSCHQHVPCLGIYLLNALHC